MKRVAAWFRVEAHRTTSARAATTIAGLRQAHAAAAGTPIR